MTLIFEFLSGLLFMLLVIGIGIYFSDFKNSTMILHFYQRNGYNIFFQNALEKNRIFIFSNKRRVNSINPIFSKNFVCSVIHNNSTFDLPIIGDKLATYFLIFTKHRPKNIKELKDKYVIVKDKDSNYSLKYIYYVKDECLFGCTYPKYYKNCKNSKIPKFSGELSFSYKEIYGILYGVVDEKTGKITEIENNERISLCINN